jgi:hypothetical protein
MFIHFQNCTVSQPRTSQPEIFQFLDSRRKDKTMQKKQAFAQFLFPLPIVTLAVSFSKVTGNVLEGRSSSTGSGRGHWGLGEDGDYK